MGKYAEYLTAAVRDRVEKLELHVLAKLSLADELAILQELFGQAVKRYARVVEATADAQVADQIRLQGLAAAMVVDAAIQVRDMTIAQHKISEPGRQVDISVLHTLVAQTVGILDQEESSEEVVQRVADRMRTELLTVDAVARSRITPDSIDAEVREMIETVPGPPELRVAHG